MNDTPQPQSDKSKYIRTYAKDVAMLAGGGGAQTPPAAPKPVPQPTAPKPHSPPPAPKPVPPPQPEPLPTPSNDEEREATLARLRQKVEESRKAMPPPPPTPAPRPIPPPPPPPVAPPPPAPERPSPIHTYKSDFSEHIDQKGASSFSVLAAEQDAKPTPAPVAKRRNTGLVVAAIALIALGGAGIGGAAWYVIRTNTLPGAPISAPSLVFADEQVRLTSSGSDLLSELSALANEPLPEGNVLVVYLVESTTDEKGNTVETPLAGGALIRAMQLPAPDILLRNVTGESTVGVASAGGETRPFFVFEVTSYERTFAGMLAWERTMARDLAVLYPAREAGSLLPSATSTAIGTSTPVAPTAALPQAAFTDAVVANHDVRILRDTAGQSLMLYGYVGKDILVLARDEAAFTALLSRLTK